MTQWDGLLTSSGTEKSQQILLGATNRPNDIDPAILRRMPKRFAIHLPDQSQRLRILQLILRNTTLTPSLSLEFLAERTDGSSGSDLHELCRNAAMGPLKEFMRREGGLEGLKKMGEANAVGAALDGVPEFTLRPLTLRDFLTVDGDELTPAGTNEPVSRKGKVEELEIDDLS